MKHFAGDTLMLDTHCLGSKCNSKQVVYIQCKHTRILTWWCFSCGHLRRKATEAYLRKTATAKPADVNPALMGQGTQEATPQEAVATMTTFFDNGVKCYCIGALRCHHCTEETV